MKKALKALLGERAALVYLAVFAIAVGVATFVENDFGTSSAQYWIYQAKWFELLLLLFAATLVYNVFNRRLWQRKQYAVLLFHLSIVLILAGSAITRWTGYEGMVHLREGGTSNTLLTRELYLSLEVEQDGVRYRGDRAIWPSSLGSFRWNHTFESPLGKVSAKVVEVVAQPAVVIEPSGGTGALKLVFGSSMGRVEKVLTRDLPVVHSGVAAQLVENETEIVPGYLGIRITAEGKGEIYPNAPMHVRVMATGQEMDLAPGQWYTLALRALYQGPRGQFVVSELEPSGSVRYVSAGKRIENGGLIGMHVQVSDGTRSDTLWVMGAQGAEGSNSEIAWNDLKVRVALGSVVRTLPFELALEDFEMTRYPGTDAPATFASDVVVLDEELEEPLRYNIHMNHILDYRGYRFFQSSYDQDELGSYLSVNHDFWGTWVTYLGYALLTLGMLWALFAKGTRFEQLWRMARGNKTVKALLPLFLVAGQHLQAQVSFVPSEDHAQRVSELFVQDFRGRMKPMHTLSREVLRKVSGKERVQEMSADAFMLSAYLAPQDWYNVPLIKVGKSPSLKDSLGIVDDVASYADCFDENGQYKLRHWVAQAQGKKPTEVNANDKSVISLDERINIMNMVFSGHFLKWIPQVYSQNNDWLGPPSHSSTDTSALARQFFGAYANGLFEAERTGNYEQVNALLAQLSTYQHEVDADLLPSETQRRTEILLNNLKPFTRLAAYYGLMALAYLILLFLDVFFGAEKFERLKPWFFAVAVALFALHTAGLGMRWYVSERAPWSNGYESLIYIGWTSVLAGLLFSRKDWGAMAATLLLSSTVLLIAMLSYLNPEITPLVPVLKSYWLTIHVSLEAGSYGFLMLGAIIGVINLLLMIVTTPTNVSATNAKIKRLTAISELTLTGGLYMLSVGTYLGGVWANESWGRYWGWDAKETWALVSILVYAFILHMRFIPALRSAFAYNVGTQFGLASIIMTYFGVNYYLSGLHSYAAGDPIPVPSWVYIASASLIVLIFVAHFRQTRLKKQLVAKK